MVDFDTEATVSIPASELTRILVLQRRNDVIDAIEAYHKQKYQKVQTTSYLVRARLYSFFFEIEGTYLSKKKDAEKEKERVLWVIAKGKEEELIGLVHELNLWLYDLGLTMLDTKTVYDRTIAEKDNEVQGV